MAMNPPFKQAKQTDMQDIEHGDVVAYHDATSGKWKRGIVYNLLSHPRRPEELIGFLVLPAETIGKNKLLPRSDYATLVKDNGTIVEKAGGTRGLHKLVVTFNMLKIRNADPVYDANNKPIDIKGREKAWVLGKHAGSNFLPELLTKVKDLHAQGEMYADGQKIPAVSPIRILNPRFAEDRTKDERFNRLRVLAVARQEGESSGRTPLGQIAKAQPAKPPKKTPEHKPTPATVAVPPVAEHFEQARRYDVRLKDLFLLVNMGGERAGIARMLGGTPEEIAENEKIVSVVNPSKAATDITLRDAVKFIDEKGNTGDLTKALQQIGSISATSTEKVVARLKELHEALNNVQTIDGKPVSKNIVIDHLIANDQLVVTGP